MSEQCPKTIVYDYLFNYFGGDTFNGKIIVGAAVCLAIRVYKDGKEVKFTDEPKPYKNNWFCDIFKVSFDREKLFVIQKDLRVDNLFRILHGFDKIEAEVVGYELDYWSSLSEDEKKELPEVFKNLPCSEPMKVSEREFRDFLREHINDFDISDNINAQVPSVSFI